jgi:hypothetical protein
VDFETLDFLPFQPIFPYLHIYYNSFPMFPIMVVTIGLEEELELFVPPFQNFIDGLIGYL